MNSQEQEIYNHLLGLAKKQTNSNSDHGVCSYLKYFRGSLHPHLFLTLPRDILKQYPFYSGHKIYPISHPVKSDPEVAYRRSRRWENDEYGNRRRGFCKWLAAQIENGNWTFKENEFIKKSKRGGRP